MAPCAFSLDVLFSLKKDERPDDEKKLSPITRKERNMENQENLFSQPVQEANEASSNIDVDLLENVTGGGFGSFLKSCIACGKPTSSKIDKLQDPDLARNHQGTPLTYEEAHADWREKYPVGHAKNSPYMVIPDHSLTIQGEPVGRIVPNTWTHSPQNH
jgi:hypothetical protein